MRSHPPVPPSHNGPCLSSTARSARDGPMRGALGRSVRRGDHPEKRTLGGAGISGFPLAPVDPETTVAVDTERGVREYRMFRHFSASLLLVVCVTLAVGCAKPVTPVSGGAASRDVVSFDPHGRDDDRTNREHFGDRIYARNEGDAVHLDSWIVFPLGGFDRDSRYVPRIGDAGNTLPAGYAARPDVYSALIAQGLLASPVGFRYAPTIVFADGTQLRGSETTLFPLFDVASVFHNPVMAGYMRSVRPGKVYLSIADEDAEGMVGRLRDDPVALVDRVDSGGGTAEDRALRRRVLTYRVRPDARMPPGPGTTAGAGSGRGAGNRK